MIKKFRKRKNRKSNAATQYENLEARQLLAVSAVLDSGNLRIDLTEAMDVATLATNNGNVTLNGNTVDGDQGTAGVQAVSVNDVSSLIIVAANDVDDAVVNLNGAFNTGDLNSISLQNINRAFLGGSYVTGSLSGNFVNSNGLFADVGTGSLTVNGFTDVSSLDQFDFSFNGDNNDFAGIVNVSAIGNVTIVDVNSINLNQVSASNLTLTAENTITDTTNANIFVSNLSTITAGSVNLGNENSTVDLFTLTSNTDGLFALNNVDAFGWRFDSVLGSADITAGNLVSTGPNASVQIIGDAIFDVFRIRVGVGGSSTFNTGRLNINSDQPAFVWENSGVQLFGDNSAPDLDIIATGNIINEAGSTVIVDGISGFQSSQTINIGNAANDTFNSGQVRFFGNQVNLNEDSGTVIRGLANFAVNLNIESNGFISDTNDAYVVVNENATFISAVDNAMSQAGVQIGESDEDFFVAGSVSFDVTDGNFVLEENNGTIVASPNGFENQANAINISSSGDVVSGVGAQIEVDTVAILSGSNISFGQGGPNDNVNFGSVNVSTGGNVVIDEDSSVVLTGGSFVGGNSVIVADGTVSDSNQSLFNTGGNLQVFGTAIQLGDLGAPAEPGAEGDIFNIGGTLRFGSGGNVEITENGNIVLAGNTTHSANVLSLTAIGNDDAAGSINNLAGADLNVTGNMFVTATSNINLGQNVGDEINFGNLNFNSATGNVTIDAIFEDENNSFFIFGTDNNPNAANELRLTTNVDVFDGTNAVIDVDDFIRVEARNITFGDTDTDCVMLPGDQASVQFVTTGADASVVTDVSCVA